MSGRLNLPGLVVVCNFCKGNGCYVSEGASIACAICKGSQFVYRDSGRPVPESVRQQIAQNSDLAADFYVYSGGYRFRRLVPRGRETFQDYTRWERLVPLFEMEAA